MVTEGRRSRNGRRSQDGRRRPIMRRHIPPRLRFPLCVDMLTAILLAFTRPTRRYVATPLRAASALWWNPASRVSYRRRRARRGPGDRSRRDRRRGRLHADRSAARRRGTRGGAAAARRDHLLLLAAGFAVERGFVDEMQGRPDVWHAGSALALRLAPHSLLTRLAPGFAQVRRARCAEERRYARAAGPISRACRKACAARKSPPARAGLSDLTC